MSYKTKIPTISKEDLNLMMSTFRDKYGVKPEVTNLDKPIKPIAPNLSQNEIESILLSEVPEADYANGTAQKTNPINSLLNIFKNKKTEDPSKTSMTTIEDDGVLRVNPYDLDKITAGRKSVLAEKNRKYQEDLVGYETKKKTIEEMMKGKKPEVKFEKLDDTAKNEFKALVNNIYQSSMDEAGFTDTQTPKNPQLMKDIFKTRMGDMYPVWQQLKQELLQKEAIEEKKYQDALKIGVPKAEADKALKEFKSKIWGY